MYNSAMHESRLRETGLPVISAFLFGIDRLSVLIRGIMLRGDSIFKESEFQHQQNVIEYRAHSGVMNPFQQIIRKRAN